MALGDDKMDDLPADTRDLFLVVTKDSMDLMVGWMKENGYTVQQFLDKDEVTLPSIAMLIRQMQHSQKIAFLSKAINIAITHYNIAFPEYWMQNRHLWKAPVVIPAFLNRHIHNVGHKIFDSRHSLSTVEHLSLMNDYDKWKLDGGALAETLHLCRAIMALQRMVLVPDSFADEACYLGIHSCLKLIVELPPGSQVLQKEILQCGQDILNGTFPYLNPDHKFVLLFQIPSFDTTAKDLKPQILKTIFHP